MLMKISNPGRSWLVLTLLTWSVVTGTALSPALAQESPVANIKTIDIDIEVWELSDSVLKEIDELEEFGGHWGFRMGLLGALQEQRVERKQSPPTRFQMKVKDGQASHLDMLNVMMDKAASLQIDLTPTLIGRDEITLDYDMVRRTKQGEIKVSGKPHVKFGNLMTQWIKPKPTDDEENKEKSWLVYVFPRQRNADGNDAVITVDSQKETNSLDIAFLPRPGRFEMQMTEGWSGHLLVNLMGRPGSTLSGTANIGASKDATASDHYVQLATFRAERPVLEVVYADDGYIQLVARRPGVASVRYRVPGLDGKSAICDLQIVVAADTTEIDRAIKEAVPQAAVKVINIKDAAMLSGIVAKEDDVALLLEVAEQFYPKIINRLKVAAPPDVATLAPHKLHEDVQYFPPAPLHKPTAATAASPAIVPERKPTPAKVTPATRTEAPRTRSHRRDPLELKALHDEVRALRDDVRRLSDLLERRPATKEADGEKTSAATRESVRATNGLLTFTAAWCGPCQKMQPILSTLEREGFPIRTVDVDKQPDLVRQFKILSIPCFVRVVDGKEIDRVAGLTTEQQLRTLMKRLPTQLDSALSKQVSMSFQETPLQEIIQSLGKLAEVNIILDRRGLEEEGLTSTVPVSIKVGDVSVRSALRLILEPLNLAIVEENEVIKVTSRQRQRGELVVMTYSIADLVIPLPEMSEGPKQPKPTDWLKLIDVITNTVEPNNWSVNGGACSVQAYEQTSSLVIRAWPDMHEQIAELLNDMRRGQDVQVVLETRLLQTADESFFERHGFDFTFDQATRSAQLDERTAKAFLTALHGAKGGALAAPKITLFDGQIASVQTQIRGQDDKVRDLKLHLRGAVSADREHVRLNVALNPHRLVNELTRQSHKVSDGGYLLLDMTDQFHRGKSEESVLSIGGASDRNFIDQFRRDDFEKPKGRVLVLVQPRVVVQAEQEKPPSKRTSQKDRAPNYLLTQFYPATDLVVPVSDEASGKPTPKSNEASRLIDHITTTIEPESWKANGGPCSIEVTGFTATKTLMIRATPEMHKAIAELVSGLRGVRGIQVVLESRLLQVADDSVLEKAGLKDEFDLHAKSVRLDERGAKRFVEAVEAEHGTMLIVPKLTLSSGKFARVGSEVLGQDDQKHGFQMYVRGLVAKDHKFVRLGVAVNDIRSLYNPPSGCWDTLNDGGSLLLDMTDQFHLGESVKLKGRVLVLLQPRIVIPEKKDVNKVVEEGVNFGGVQPRTFIQEEEEELLGIPAKEDAVRNVPNKQ